MVKSVKKARGARGVRSEKGTVVLPNRILDPYSRQLLEQVEALGGFSNWHAHLDRADTLDPMYLSQISLNPLDAAIMPLTVKQNLVGYIHRGPAYTEKDLRERVSRVLRRCIAFGTTRLSTCCDVCPGIAEGGLLAWRILRELKAEFAGQIDLQIGPSPIFGFKQGSGRWETYLKAAKDSDFITALPEKDDFDISVRGSRDGKIGFEQHIRRILELAYRLRKEVHLHLDQADDPSEEGTIRLIRVIDGMEQKAIDWFASGKPKIWVVHMISPSSYTEEKFRQLLKDLKRLNIGVIICPTAAISMRRLRPITAPMHNSVARLLELIKWRIPIRIGTDNICDVFVPGNSGDMLTEVAVMGTNVVRFYPITVWAKLAAGTPLNEVDIDTVGRALYQDTKAFMGIDPEWEPAIA